LAGREPTQKEINDSVVDEAIDHRQTFVSAEAAERRLE
jgi:hypothetical protein